MRTISLLAAALLLSGCASINDRIVSAVDEYCVRITASERALIRERVNAELAAKGHSVSVTCAGD